MKPLLLTYIFTFNLLGCETKDPHADDNASMVSADILFVMDNSSSTAAYSAATLAQIPTFLNSLKSGRPSVDFHVAVTTTTVDMSIGFTEYDDPGEAGLFVGDSPIVGAANSGNSHQLSQNLGCWASCWNAYDMPSDDTYTGVAGDCPFPESDEATTQYVDCLCNDVAGYPDGENWDSQELCGAGNEMPVEAALLAMCRAVASPPDICFHTDSPFQSSWAGTNAGWLRENTPTHIVFVTDEGDNSQINVGGLYGNSEDEPEVYLSAFAEFDRDIKFTAIGPTLDCNEGQCNTTCSNVMYPPSRTGSMRLKNLADATGGLYLGITEIGDNGNGGESCAIADFGAHLNALADRLREF